MKKVAFVLVLGSYLSHLAGAVGFPVQVVSGMIMSVNGSAEDMGCTSPLTVTDGLTTCGSSGNGAISYLVDGVSPDIDTSTSDWASQLVTVRRSEGTADVPVPHVLLTFGFDTAVNLTGIEIDLFNCPDWNIGTPDIRVYLNPEYDLVYNLSVETFSFPNPPIQSSCNSLSTVTFSGGSLAAAPYHTIHILVDLTSHPSIEWLHVAEVRFIGTDDQPIVCPLQTMSSYSITPSPTTSPPAGPFSASPPPLSAGEKENDCTCSEESSGSAVIAVSAVSLLLIVILTTVILTQCLLIIRMRRSRNKTETYAEATSPTINTTHVPVSPNEAYALTKIASPREEVTYELVK